MEVIKLKLDEFIPFYKSHVYKDFSGDELKEIYKIEDLYEKDLFTCYIAKKDSKILGYIILSTSEEKKAKLLEYFVMNESIRNKGYGSRFLNYVLEEIDCQLYIEVEDPNRVKNKHDIKEIELRNRRINFYKRNGIYKTLVTVKMYNGAYRILANAKKENHKLIKDVSNKIIGVDFDNETIKKDLFSIYNTVKTIDAKSDEIDNYFIVE